MGDIWTWATDYLTDLVRDYRWILTLAISLAFRYYLHRRFEKRRQWEDQNVMRWGTVDPRPTFWDKVKARFTR